MRQTNNSWIRNRVSLFPAMAIISLITLSGASGCSFGDAETPVGVVSGQVTLDGEPLDSGMIRFHDQTRGDVAGAPLKGPGGEYQLSFGGQERIPTGKYLVTVSPLPEGDVDAARGGAIQPKKPVSHASDMSIPKKYQNQRTTDLIADVVEGENKINLDLKSN